MTIKLDKGRNRLVCGACHYPGEPYDRRDFQKMIDAARDAGWRIRLVAGVWDHTCPSCAEVAAKDKRRQGRMF